MLVVNIIVFNCQKLTAFSFLHCLVVRNAWRIQKTITCLVQTGTHGHGQAQQEISIMEIVDQFEHYSVFQCLICTIEINPFHTSG